MKAYEKYLNEENDRLVEVHTDWLKEIDNYIKRLEYDVEQSELNYLKGQEIFIGRFERLENQFKKLAEVVIELEIDKEKPNEKLKRLRGDI